MAYVTFGIKCLSIFSGLSTIKIRSIFKSTFCTCVLGTDLGVYFLLKEDVRKWWRKKFSLNQWELKWCINRMICHAFIFAIAALLSLHFHQNGNQWMTNAMAPPFSHLTKNTYSIAMILWGNIAPEYHRTFVTHLCVGSLAG
jgi:hypothetical protein